MSSRITKKKLIELLEFVNDTQLNNVDNIYVSHFFSLSGIVENLKVHSFEDVCKFYMEKENQ